MQQPTVDCPGVPVWTPRGGVQGTSHICYELHASRSLTRPSGRSVGITVQRSQAGAKFRGHIKGGSKDLLIRPS